MKPRFLGLIILSALALSACSVYKINSKDVSQKIYFPKDPAKIVYLQDVQRSYEVIGFVTVNANRNSSQGEIIDKMRFEAAQLGGDALTNLKESAPGSWKKVPWHKLAGNGYIRADFTATVIAFRH